MKHYTLAEFIPQESVCEKRLDQLLRYASDFRKEHRPHPLKRGRKVWSKGKICSVCNLRLGDIRRIIEGLFGGPCDTDDGEAFFESALVHLIARHIAYGKGEEGITAMLMDWAWKHTRRVVTDHPRAWFDEQRDRILLSFDNDNGRPTIPAGDEVSQALGIRQAWVEEFGLKTLTSIERPRHVRTSEANARKAAREKARRAAEGAVSHEASISRRKPWERYGLGRSAYYAKVQAGEIIPDAAMRKVRNKMKAAKAAPTLKLTG